MLKHFAHPATAIAMLALLVATAGGSFAAGALIGSSQIADHSIQLRDLSPSAIAALRGHAGPAGAAGANGTFDPAKVSRVIGDRVPVAPGAVGTAFAACPVGQVAVGGGGDGSISGLSASFPSVPAGATYPPAWGILTVNNSGIAVSIQAYAVCAAP